MFFQAVVCTSTEGHGGTVYYIIMPRHSVLHNHAMMFVQTVVHMSTEGPAGTVYCIIMPWCLSRLWFVRPLKDLQVLEQRLDAIAYLTEPRHAEVLTSLQSCLKHIKNVAVSQLPLSLTLSVSLSVSLSLSVCLSLSPCVSLCLCLSLSLSNSLFFCVFMYLLLFFFKTHLKEI